MNSSSASATKIGPAVVSNLVDTARFTTLKVSVDGPRVELTFDHGRVNEMGSQQLGEFEELTRQLSESAGIVALITRSTRVTRKGTPIFVAGADVTERVGWTDAQVKAHVRRQRRVLGALAGAPVFHVAVVDGAALGWGTEYLLTADYRIATSQASFGLPETGLGILPGAGGTSELWAQIGVAHTLRLGMTGERVNADEACRIGLVQETVSTAEIGLGRARDLCGRVARCSPTAVAAFKAAVQASAGADRRTELEAQAYEHCVDTGNAATGRSAFADIRKGNPVAWPERVLWTAPPYGGPEKES